MLASCCSKIGLKGRTKDPVQGEKSTIYMVRNVAKTVRTSTRVTLVYRAPDDTRRSAELRASLIERTQLVIGQQA